MAFEVDAGRSLRHENAAVPLDDGRGNHDRRHEAGRTPVGADRHADAIGHTRHFGLRATQTIAPRSISA